MDQTNATSPEMDQTNTKRTEIVPSNAKSNEENKTKKGHGNEFGGLVLVGGALTVAALVAIFAMERKKMKESKQKVAAMEKKKMKESKQKVAAMEKEKIKNSIENCTKDRNRESNKTPVNDITNGSPSTCPVPVSRDSAGNQTPTTSPSQGGRIHEGKTSEDRRESSPKLGNDTSMPALENVGREKGMDEEPVRLWYKICRILFILTMLLYLIFSLSCYPVSGAILSLFRGGQSTAV